MSTVSNEIYDKASRVYMSLSFTHTPHAVHTTDTPSSLFSQLQDELLFYNDEVSSATFELYFNLLYSVYSIPNILLPFLGR